MFKVALINNTDRKLELDFDYDEIKNSGININNINKSELNNYYDFILIYEDDDK